jgi:hypothetical protein
MAYEVSWYQPKRVIYLQVSGAFTIKELERAAVFIGDGIRNSAVPVHLIVDVRAVKSIPTNVLEIKTINDYLGHDKMGWLIIVGAHSLVNMIAVVISQLMKTQYRNFKQLDAALQFLMEEDEGVGELRER